MKDTLAIMETFDLMTLLYTRYLCHTRTHTHTHTHPHTHTHTHTLLKIHTELNSVFIYSSPVIIAFTKTISEVESIWKLRQILFLWVHYLLYLLYVLQTGRSRDRFPMVSLEFFINILPAALWPWGRLSL
jgi:hypothetical protein